MDKLLFFFGSVTEGKSQDKTILGGKGANLAKMCELGLPIPPGFTIGTKLCQEYSNTNIISDQIKREINNYIKKLEQETGKEFGGKNPLLVSVRSGAAISMPGMMDTVLNLGMNDDVVQYLATITGDARFAHDSYRRFIEMFSSVVLDIPHYHFDEILENYKFDKGYQKDSDLAINDLHKIIDSYKIIVKKYSGSDFEADPKKQLFAAIEAVLKSWDSPRAIAYRQIKNINNLAGTAVNIQSMVFGNKNDNSATGVVFTRNPINGEAKMFGEFLVNAQGEDVVAGIRTPLPVNDADDGQSMQKLMPEQYAELEKLCIKLERHFLDMQDIEFTIEDGKLFLLQTRSGKRSAAASIKIAADMVKEKIMSKEKAILSVDVESLNQLLHTTIDYSAEYEKIASGLPASPGAGTGIAVFSSSEAEEMSVHHKVILIRNDTSPEDIKGMHVSEAIITARGGMTSHAAVVARGMGKPCVCGISNIKIDEISRTLTTEDGTVINAGDILTIDGSSGAVIRGAAKLIVPNFSDDFREFLSWCDEFRRLKIRTNAETILDSSTALKFGAKGIGLCRTEHMFFDKDKIPLIHQMIVAKTQEMRNAAIEKLAPMQSRDFKDLFQIMQGRAINIRLLDPPLHEFLPVKDLDKEALAENLGMQLAEVEARVQELREANPMLGHRGCRLGVSTPEIYKMQITAILDALWQLRQTGAHEPKLELMIPLVSEEKELVFIKNYLEKLIEAKEQEYDTKFEIKLGTMIELPRACLLSDELAKHVSYFSFGSNDLTQTTYGISRDDIGSFLPYYIGNQIFEHDPFAVIDHKAVGELIAISVQKAKETNPGISFGVCGEHAGNPISIEFFEKLKLDYISCSPYRVPIARVAAAQSYIKLNKS